MPDDVRNASWISGKRSSLNAAPRLELALHERLDLSQSDSMNLPQPQRKCGRQGGRRWRGRLGRQAHIAETRFVRRARSGQQLAQHVVPTSEGRFDHLACQCVALLVPRLDQHPNPGGRGAGRAPGIRAEHILGPLDPLLHKRCPRWVSLGSADRDVQSGGPLNRRCAAGARGLRRTGASPPGRGRRQCSSRASRRGLRGLMAVVLVHASDDDVIEVVRRDFEQREHVERMAVQVPSLLGARWRPS